MDKYGRNCVWNSLKIYFKTVMLFAFHGPSVKCLYFSIASFHNNKKKLEDIRILVMHTWTLSVSYIQFNCDPHQLLWVWIKYDLVWIFRSFQAFQLKMNANHLCHTIMVEKCVKYLSIYISALDGKANKHKPLKRIRFHLFALVQ